MTAGMQKTLIAAAAAIFVNNAGAQTAAISDDVVKIGVLTDMSAIFPRVRRRFGHCDQDGR